jgi:hypothetical protein
LTAKPRAPVGDEVEGEGISLAEPIAPGPINSNTPTQADPSVVDRVASSAPSVGGQKRKRLSPISKRKLTKSLTNQVMIQAELAPYHGPQRSLDLVAIEIIFGHLFEVF